MLSKISTIKKRADFLLIKNLGKKYKSNCFIIEKLLDKNLKNNIRVGYTVTKKVGNAVKRNKAKRIMRILANKNFHKYGQLNHSYVLIAKKSIFEYTFEELNTEFIELIKKWIN